MSNLGGVQAWEGWDFQSPPLSANPPFSFLALGLRALYGTPDQRRCFASARSMVRLLDPESLTRVSTGRCL